MSSPGRSPLRTPFTSGMSYEEIKRVCLSERRQWEDPDFPATATSIHPHYDDPQAWLWKRPKELCVSPKFIVDGVTRWDLAQGELGNCWFVAAAAVLATKPDLFHQVVPSDQGMLQGYAGVFRFNFWRFGEWKEVLVDDRLPVDVDGNLKFAHNRTETDEFWGPLLEKAFAKMHGSYESLQLGYVRDALVDLTGGMSETFNLKKTDDLPPNLFEIILSSFHAGSLLGACIWSESGDTTEELIYNGLYRGHIYSVTSIVETRIQGWNVKLLRLRNPWGCKEWNGAWSDTSDEWNAVPEDEKKALGLVVCEDGEFWMSYDDFMKNFNTIEILHIGPETFSRLGFPPDSIRWYESVYHGKWVKGVNAGGAGLLALGKNLYTTNPRFYVTLTVPDEGDVAEECTCIISLMQKDFRKRQQTPGLKRLLAGFDVHQLKSGDPSSVTNDNFFDVLKPKKQFRTRTPLREVSCRLSLDPGTYCITVSTLKANEEGEFLLRVYTYEKAPMQQIKEKTGPIEPSTTVTAMRAVGDLSSDFFFKYADEEDHVVDARDLRDMLNELGRKELGGTTAFSVEACRSLISMFDDHRKGSLDFVQAATLWDEILFWWRIYKRYDKDESGCIDTFELRKVFQDIGFSLSFDTICTLALRYGGRDRTLFFEDLVLCLCKTMTMYTLFKHYSEESAGEARLDIEEWMKTTLFY